MKAVGKTTCINGMLTSKSTENKGKVILDILFKWGTKEPKCKKKKSKDAHKT